MRFVLRLLINAAALWVATRIVPGVAFAGEPVYLIVVALVFGLLNALVRPILTLLTCPLLVLTLGLFTFVINAVILLLTSALSEKLGIGFSVSGFWAAFLGALVVSIISILLSLLIPDPERPRA